MSQLLMALLQVCRFNTHSVYAIECDQHSVCISSHVAGADYNAVSTSVSFSGGQRSDAISIPTFDDDDTEPKTFTASLSAGSIPPGLNVEIDPPSATFTILTIDGMKLCVCICAPYHQPYCI